MKTHKARATKKTTGKASGGVKASGRAMMKRTAEAPSREPVEARYDSHDELEDMMAALELLSSTQPS